MQDILDTVYRETLPHLGEGQVANYIPALGQVNPDQLGIAIYTNKGETFSIGDAQVPFSIQSISKVFSLSLAMQLLGESIWKRVGREPSGLPFNSLVQLEHENGIPRNPFINSGALVVADIIESGFATANIVMKTFLRKLVDNELIQTDLDVARSEFEHRSRNAAMAYLMKSFGNFENDVDTVLKSYFVNCSVTMTCEDLAKAASYLANQGRQIGSQKSIINAGQARQINALMATSGLYDEAGNFAFKVGMPGKSGVGGGIIGVVPNKLTLCVWSPRLNKMGNSHAGMVAMELLSSYLDCSIY
jgi:glutaminase